MLLPTPSETDAPVLDAIRPLKRVVYSSRLSTPLTPDAMDALLATARRRNRSVEVTGLLCHYDGHFLQYLEGPALAVNTVFASIGRDARHADITVLLDAPIPARAFAGWFMARAELDPLAWMPLYLARWLPEDPLAASAPAESPGVALLHATWHRYRSRPALGADPGPPGY